MFSLWSFSNQGGEFGFDFFNPIISPIVLELLVNCNRVLVCSETKRLPSRQSGILLIQKYSTQNFLTSEYILIQHLTLLHLNTLCCPWYLIQLHTRFSAMYGQCLAISDELQCSCMVRNCHVCFTQIQCVSLLPAL